MSFSRSFESQDALDRIWDVLHLPEKPSIDACRAAEGEISYLLRIASCCTTSIPGCHFTDLFPQWALEKFTDSGHKDIQGKTLREECAAWYENCTSSWYGDSIPRNFALVPDFPTNGNISDAYANELYMRLYALPRFSAWLANAFSSCLYHERELVEQSNAEAEALCVQVVQGYSSR